MRKWNSLDITVSAGAFLSLALSLLILPLDWIVAWLLAALIHEAFHYVALLLCGARVYELRIQVFGAVMESDEINGIPGFLCAVAGPVGGLLLLLCARWMPRLALCGFVQSAFNLLPIYPLDGSRVLWAVLGRFSHGSEMQKWIEKIICGMLLGILLWLSVRFHLGAGGVLIFITFLLLRNREKLLANCVNKEYNRGNPKR